MKTKAFLLAATTAGAAFALPTAAQAQDVLPGEGFIGVQAGVHDLDGGQGQEPSWDTGRRPQTSPGASRAIPQIGQAVLHPPGSPRRAAPGPRLGRRS